MEKFEERFPFTIEHQSQKIFVVVHRPLTDQLTPGVVFCHGYGGQKTGRNRNYVLLAQELSKAGIASIRFDFRGCGDSEGNFNLLAFQDHLADLMHVLANIPSEAKIDLTRLGIFGRSLGGALAILGAAKFKNVCSLALWAPIFTGKLLYGNFGGGEIHENMWSSIQKKMRVNGQYPSISFLKEVAVLDLTEPFSALHGIPFLHLHGEKDPVVSIDHAHAYAKHRFESPTHTKFIKLSTGDHDFSLPEDQELAIKETVQWFRGTL